MERKKEGGNTPTFLSPISRFSDSFLDKKIEQKTGYTRNGGFNFKLSPSTHHNMASIATATEMKYPMLCIPRGMLFHKADFVEKSLNIAMDSPRGCPFVKSVECKLTKDKDGKEFNVFFITPNQEFVGNDATALVYKKLDADGVVNISTGSKGYFWKVKLYVPNLKSKFVQPKAAGPRIMTEEDNEAFRVWREKRAAAKAAKAAAAPENKGAWEQEEGEITEKFE